MATPTAWSWPEMLGGVAWESKRVVAAHSRHFLALSVLFLLPLSSLLVAAPSLLLAFPSLCPHSIAPPQSLLRSSLSGDPRRLPSDSVLAFALALFYATGAAALVLCATAAATHSVHRGFFGRSVRLLPALRSLPASLWRLLLTLLAAALSVSAFIALLASLLFLSLRALSLLRPSSPPFATPLAFSVAGAATALGLIYLQVTWSLATVVAVVESSWGFAPLRRSAHLVRGMMRAVLCLDLFFAAGIGVTLWSFSLSGVGVAGRWSEVVPVVVRTIFGSAVTALLLLYCLVTNVVMYMYCKALHGDLAREIAEEFAWEYVCLPFDDQKVPHIVSVIRQ